MGRPARVSSERGCKMEPSSYNPTLIISHVSFQHLKWQMERKADVEYIYANELDAFRGEVTEVIQIFINLLRKVPVSVEIWQLYIDSNKIRLDRRFSSSRVFEKLKWYVGDSSDTYQDLIIRRIKWQSRSFHHLQALLKSNSVQNFNFLSARKSSF